MFGLGTLARRCCMSVLVCLKEARIAGEVVYKAWEAAVSS